MKGLKAAQILAYAGVFLIFVVFLWSFFVTDYLAENSYDEQRITLKSKWENNNNLPFPKKGEAFALLSIPKIDVVEVPVIQGTDSEHLERGVGHHSESAMPGGKGNFVVAGHRVTWGRPFWDIDQLSDGDLIYVDQNNLRHTYVVSSEFVVNANDSASVLNPVKNENTITLYSCEPKFSADKRIVVRGVLFSTLPIENTRKGWI